MRGGENETLEGNGCPPSATCSEGTFQQSEFAADITAVSTGKASREYQNAVAFFDRTFITEGMAFC